MKSTAAKLRRSRILARKVARNLVANFLISGYGVGGLGEPTGEYLTGHTMDNMAHVAAAYEELPVGVAVCDLAWNQLYSNRVFRSLFGDAHRLTDLTTSNIAMVFGAVGAQNSVSTEMRLETLNGPRWFLATASTLPSNQDLRVLLTTPIQEIHDRLTSVAKREAWLESALSASQQGIWEFDYNAELAYWNDELFRMLHYPNRFPMQKGTVFGLIHEDDRENYAAALEQVKSGAPERLETEVRILCGDGLYRWIRVVGRPIRDWQGQPERMVGTAMDIDDRRRAEEAVRELNANLEERVLSRTRQLEVANEELHAFCYSVSHDLRGPLRGMNGFAHALEQDYKDVLGSEGVEYVHRIQQSSLKLSRLIDALLTMSRVTRAPMERVQVDLAETADSVWQEILRTNGPSEVEFTRDQNLETWGDPNLLYLVVTNLLTNAHKFTKGQPVQKIHFGRVKDEFFVRDTGVGFNPQYAHRLFLPFERLHTEREFPGTGIGLAIVSRILTRHNGTIRAESEPEFGTTFYFKLPLRKKSRTP